MSIRLKTQMLLERIVIDPLHILKSFFTIDAIFQRKN